ncbi:MAG: exo-alpha-sialidase [Saprospiraceae bacterium]|nr:exo-alpha-sialidase [Saprospiraceae bacterium]
MDRLANFPILTIPQNILIDSNNTLGSFHPCEPSICISPANPNQIVAGAVLNRTYHSLDFGRSWSTQLVSSTYGVYGDPVIIADKHGNFYYAHLADPSGKGRSSQDWLDRIVIQRSEDGGTSWNNGSFAGYRPPRDQDKHWLAVDDKSKALYMTWTEFDKYGSADSNDRSRILFSKSVDEGDQWSDAISISGVEGNCLDDDQTTEGAVPTVGPKGQIYVSWSYDEKIYFDKSLDAGGHWLDTDIIAANQMGGWSFDIPGLGRANGMPITAVDISKSRYRGRIYINYCDQSNGSDDTDVWIVYSDDEGNSWSAPKRVNDDGPGKHQFFTWMSVDPTSGAIYIVFYDRRAHDDNHTDVFLAYSFDGGQHFRNVKISSSTFLPNTSIFFGDYNNISAYKGRVRPIWTRMDENKTSIWTALIDFR